jgi:hypothetical protein
MTIFSLEDVYVIVTSEYEAVILIIFSLEDVYVFVT